MNAFILISILVFLGILVLLLFLLYTTQKQVHRLLNESERERITLEEKTQREETIRLTLLDRLSRLEQEQTTSTTLLHSTLGSVDKNVESRVVQSTKATQESYTEIAKRLERMDEAQRYIEKVSSEIASLTTILTNHKHRGNFGEFQLNTILELVFGTHSHIFQTQVKLQNGTLVDALIHTSSNEGHIPIDSKFPLSNYSLAIDATKTEQERKVFDQNFKKDVEKHLKDIHEKYMLADETAGQGIIFIPAEGIYVYIHEHHPSLIEKAYKYNITFASPSTLLIILDAILRSIKHEALSDNMNKIKKELAALSNDFRLLDERNDAMTKSIASLTKVHQQFETSTKNIVRRYGKIERIELDDEVEA